MKTTTSTTTTSTIPQRKRKGRVVGNPFSQGGHLRHGDGRLSRPGMILVATLVVIFATAAIHVFVIPMFVVVPTTSSTSSTTVSNLQSISTLSKTGGLRGGGDIEQRRRVDWMEQQAEAQAEQVAQQAIDNSLLLNQANNNQQDGGDDSPLIVLTVSDDLGRLLIRPRADLSPESVQYMQQLAADASQCDRCQFYRAEKPGILQGIASSQTVPVVTQRGPCPLGLEHVPNACPAWDADCACHGPVMTRGMVAWAGGKTGPDFFINAYPDPVELWGTQHTVFGQVLPVSWPVLDKIWTLPTKREANSAMTFLEKPLTFSLSLQRE